MEMEISVEKKRRARAPNFSETEKRVFIEKFKRYSTTIENKKTDAISRDEKIAAWELLTEEVNTTFPVQRTVQSLQTLWDNMKSKARKNKAKEKKEIFKTGGGTRDPNIGLTANDEEVLQILGPSGTVLEDENGGDKLPSFNEDAEGQSHLPPGKDVVDAPLKSSDINENVDAQHSKPNCVVKLLAMAKAPPLQFPPAEVKKRPTVTDALTDAQTDLAVATKIELEKDSQRKQELHELQVKKLKLENELLQLQIIKMKQELGLVRDFKVLDNGNT